MNGNIPKFEEILVSFAHGRGGARATSKNVSAPPSVEKIRAVQQSLAKRKERDFARRPAHRSLNAGGAQRVPFGYFQTQPPMAVGLCLLWERDLLLKPFFSFLPACHWVVPDEVRHTFCTIGTKPFDVRIPFHHIGSEKYHQVCFFNAVGARFK